MYLYLCIIYLLPTPPVAPLAFITLQFPLYYHLWFWLIAVLLCIKLLITVNRILWPVEG